MEYVIEVLKGDYVVTKYTYKDRDEAISFYVTLDSKFRGSTSTTIRYREIKSQ